MAVRLRIFLIFALSVTQLAASSLARERWTILPTSEGKDLVGQCSRECPYDAKSFWAPSTSQVAGIEQRLPALLHASGHKIDLSHSCRQYLGIVVHGKRIIYMSAIDISVISGDDWRAKALVVCDGGDIFWGVEFDPATNTFAHLAFNGAI